MSKVCKTCQKPAKWQCPCLDAAYCSQECQSIDYHYHFNYCSVLAERTLCEKIVPDHLMLGGLWKVPLAIQRANEMYLLYGDPTTIADGVATWTTSRIGVYVKMEVFDRCDLKQQKPYEHIHIVSATLPMIISNEKLCELVKEDFNFTYDKELKQCRVTGDTFSICALKLQMIRLFSKTYFSLKEIKEYLPKAMTLFHDETQIAENDAKSHKSFAFYATPRTNQLLLDLSKL